MEVVGTVDAVAVAVAVAVGVAVAVAVAVAVDVAVHVGVDGDDTDGEPDTDGLFVLLAEAVGVVEGSEDFDALTELEIVRDNVAD